MTTSVHEALPMTVNTDTPHTKNHTPHKNTTTHSASTSSVSTVVTIPAPQLGPATTTGAVFPVLDWHTRGTEHATHDVLLPSSAEKNV